MTQETNEWSEYQGKCKGKGTCLDSTLNDKLNMFNKLHLPFPWYSRILSAL